MSPSRPLAPDFDFRLLRYFVTVARTQGFSAAADELHVSQPALSQGIRRLERIVGSALIVRGPRGSTRGLALTPAGETLLPAAIDVLDRMGRAVQAARQVSAKTTIRIGFSTNTPRDLVRRALELSAVLPTHIELQHVAWGEELGSLRRGELDLVFLQRSPSFEAEDLRIARLGEIPRVAVFRIGHEQSGRESVSIADLASEPIIDAASDRDFWLVNPRPDGRVPQAVGPPARTVEEMLAFVSAGRGMAITSESVAESNGSAELVFIPISDLEPSAMLLAANESDRRPITSAILTHMYSSANGQPEAGEPAGDG